MKPLSLVLIVAVLMGGCTKDVKTPDQPDRTVTSSTTTTYSLVNRLSNGAASDAMIVMSSQMKLIFKPNIPKPDTVYIVKTDTVYGPFAEYPANGTNKIAVVLYPDPLNWNTSIRSIDVGSTTYPIVNGFITVPVTGISTLAVHVQSATQTTGAAIQIRDYFDNLVTYNSCTQQAGAQQVVKFPYFDTKSVCAITLSDFGPGHTSATDSRPNWLQYKQN